MRTHWVLANLSSRSVNEGGLITLVSKSFCPWEESITHLKMIPGRVSRVLIQDEQIEGTLDLPPFRRAD